MTSEVTAATEWTDWRASAGLTWSAWVAWKRADTCADQIDRYAEYMAALNQEEHAAKALERLMFDPISPWLPAGIAHGL